MAPRRVYIGSVFRACLGVMMLSAAVARADRPFPVTWTSATQPAGTSDAQLWLTWRSQRQSPYDRLEVRGWANVGATRSVDLHLGFEADLVVQRRETKDADGRLSALVRYRFFEPNEVIGVALLARVAVGLASSQLEARVVFDRLVGDVLLALNSSFERTIFWDRRDAIETRLDHSLAARLQVTSEVSAGLEVRARQALKSDEYQGTAFLLGPTISVSTPVVWVSVGAYTQIASHKADGDRGNGLPLIFRDDERFTVRLTLAAPTARR